MAIVRRRPHADLGNAKRRFVIAPIRFDKRSFDGGIEPFNC
jgi:hypothetical protein